MTPEEISQLRGLIKPAVVLLLMLRLDRPVGAKEIARILNLDQHTAARYLRSLSRLNLVASAGYNQGYILLGGRQLILGERPDVKNAHLPPTTTTLNIVRNERSEGEVGLESVRDVKNARHEPPKRAHDVKIARHEPAKPPCNVKNAHFTSTVSEPTPLLQSLLEAGIGEPKRSALSALPHLTPAYVKAWESQLKLTKGERYSPGLLIHVLECGDPAPPTNSFGHVLRCRCPDCERLKYLVCPYCHAYPCECP